MAVRYVVPLPKVTLYWWAIPPHYRGKQRRKVVERSGYRKQCLTLWHWFGLLDICR